MRSLIRRALPALAMALGIALTSVTGAQAAAPSAPTSSDVTAACSTWQYRIKTGSPIYATKGGEPKGWHALPGDYFNASITGDMWYRGTFYTQHKAPYTSGWITKRHLSYVTCW